MYKMIIPYTPITKFNVKNVSLCYARMIVVMTNDFLIMLPLRANFIMLQHVHTCIGGHLSSTITTWKILDACYQWPIFHNNNIAFYQLCDCCQRPSDLTRVLAW